MGLFRRAAAAEPWSPPPLGACGCEAHVDDLRGVLLPRVSDSGDVTAGALVESGALCAEPADGGSTYTRLPLTGQRVGPFHWQLRLGDEALDLFRVDAAAALDDSLSLQPGVERVGWPVPELLLVGAPTLCASGVLAAAVRALANPRVRLPLP